MTLPVAEKSDCGFVGSKHNTQINWKVHMMMEVIQADPDHVVGIIIDVDLAL
jgi:hypothetical protein